MVMQILMHLLMEVWKAEPKLQAKEGFSRLAQASSGLIPALYSCFFRVSFLNMGIWKKNKNQGLHFLCWDWSPRIVPNFLESLVWNSAFLRKLFSSELSQIPVCVLRIRKESEWVNIPIRSVSSSCSPYCVKLKVWESSSRFFFLDNMCYFAREEWGTTKESHRRAHYFLKPAKSWREETEQASWLMFGDRRGQGVLRDSPVNKDLVHQDVWFP